MRYHYMDWARALCMLLGIPYHAALLFSPDPWSVQAAPASALITNAARFMSIFRMPTFFLIAGFFAAIVVTRRGTGVWLRKRAVVLLVPLASAVVLINPFLYVARDAAYGRYHGVADAVAQRLHDSTELLGPLWFLPTLFLLCCIYAVIRTTTATPAGDKRGGRFVIPAASATPLIALAGFVLWEVAVELLMRGVLDAALLNNGFVNASKLLQYLPFFLLGALLAEDNSFCDRFLALTPACILLAVAAPAAFITLTRIGAAPWLIEASKAFSALFVSRFVLAALRRFSDRRSAVIDTFVSTSFTIYLVHMPLVFGFGCIALLINWHPVIEFAAVCAAVLASALALALIVERQPLLKFLFNGVAPASGAPLLRVPSFPNSPRI